MARLGELFVADEDGEEEEEDDDDVVDPLCFFDGKSRSRFQSEAEVEAEEEEEGADDSAVAVDATVDAAEAEANAMAFDRLRRLPFSSSKDGADIVMLVLLCNEKSRGKYGKIERREKAH